MEKEEIIEWNKLIDVFMEYKRGVITARYHESWDELMPVVEKIGLMYKDAFPSMEDFEKSVRDKMESTLTVFLDVIALPLCTSIKGAYPKVLNFIKWYNENKKIK